MISQWRDGNPSAAQEFDLSTERNFPSSPHKHSLGSDEDRGYGLPELQGLYDPGNEHDAC